MHPGVPIFMVYVGCCTNVIFLEQLIKSFPSCGNILTFSAFVFNCLEGLIVTTRFFTKPSAIPIKYYLVMVSLFFVVQTLNNYTLGFNISMPLHMIFRSGSLIANLILGVIIMKKKYKLTKYLSVALITVGIVTCTLASASHKDGSASDSSSYGYMVWLTGLGLLVLSLFLSAFMGIFQEQTYSKYGKHPAEALFYNHFLPLPGFLFLLPNIMTTVGQFNESDPYVVPVVGGTVPWAWLWLSFNTITQFICLRSVFILTSECTSLTVTLVVTLRKFVSLLFSILYFKNPFTSLHWCGAVCVFLGTLVFVEVFRNFDAYKRLENRINGEEKKKLK